MTGRGQPCQGAGLGPARGFVAAGSLARSEVVRRLVRARPRSVRLAGTVRARWDAARTAASHGTGSAAAGAIPAPTKGGQRRNQYRRRGNWLRCQYPRRHLSQSPADSSGPSRVEHDDGASRQWHDGASHGAVSNCFCWLRISNKCRCPSRARPVRPLLGTISLNVGEIDGTLSSLLRRPRRCGIRAPRRHNAPVSNIQVAYPSHVESNPEWETSHKE